ncbi:MAG: acetoacetate decarboxylase family protein, partial [Proteobacteria bacterium]|nr:acetoacetate decarboxylase family protein [Pseudomonadota bacterium]
PHGPFHFVGREYFVVLYESDPAAIRAALPEPLEPAGDNLVAFEWMRTPDASGFGAYTAAGVVIPAMFKGVRHNFIAQMYLDDDAPIAAGREIWGFPQKYAEPTLKVASDTLSGTLVYAGQPVANGSMTYKHDSRADDLQQTVLVLIHPQVTLKLLPGPDGKPEICQLVTFTMQDVTVTGSWNGPARLELIPHANAPAADLPVKRVVIGRHFIADLTLPYGTVLHDYLA